MRPIDADAITYCAYDLDAYHFFRAVDEEDIAEMPTLTLDDLRPHGNWVVERKHSHGKFSHCSECLTVQLTADTKKMRYCPHCGADMRGGGEG